MDINQDFFPKRFFYCQLPDTRCEGCQRPDERPDTRCYQMPDDRDQMPDTRCKRDMEGEILRRIIVVKKRGGPEMIIIY